MSACAPYGKGGPATPGSARDFSVNVGDIVYFSTDQHRSVAGSAADAGRSGALAAAVREIHHHDRRPRRRARHPRVQHRARCPARPDRCATFWPAMASAQRASARSPTARSARSRSATTSPAGRRIAARRPSSTTAAAAPELACRRFDKARAGSRNWFRARQRNGRVTFSPRAVRRCRSSTAARSTTPQNGPIVTVIAQVN